MAGAEQAGLCDCTDQHQPQEPVASPLHQGRPAQGTHRRQRIRRRLVASLATLFIIIIIITLNSVYNDYVYITIFRL